MNSIIEYIWIDGQHNLRSKARTMKHLCKNPYDLKVIDIPEWNYDGSSTEQADGENSEVILKPCAIYKCPFREGNNYLVLCETYNTDNKSLKNNYRVKANEIFNSKLDEEPWYGIEQEFFMIDMNTKQPLNIKNLNLKGKHYCGIGINYKTRKIMDEMYDACLYSNLDISGINAEVAEGQWEYQIGPVCGINASDQLLISRYIIQRIAEKYDVLIDFQPKPILGDVNGSGCHTNFSTKTMRQENGLDIIQQAIKKLSKKHEEHMDVYGENNHLRMTGTCETSSYDIFSYGVGSRTSSIRIPTSTFNNKCGYFEDRRPSSNMNPYLVTSKLFETCCL